MILCEGVYILYNFLNQFLLNLTRISNSNLKLLSIIVWSMSYENKFHYIAFPVNAKPCGWNRVCVKSEMKESWTCWGGVWVGSGVRVRITRVTSSSSSSRRNSSNSTIVVWSLALLQTNPAQICRIIAEDSCRVWIPQRSSWWCSQILTTK